MCPPAAAALLLAALAALPCRGTDPNATLRILNETLNLETTPTVNKFYEMLHSTELHNQSEFNYSSLNPLYSLDAYSNVGRPTSTDNVECCLNDVGMNVNVNSSGANPILDGDSKNRKRRVVKIIHLEMTTEVYGNIEGTTISVPTSQPPIVMERKRKPGETGSSAPLLNYIFDAYSNTHTHHKNEKPSDGNSIYAAAAPEIEALVGSTAHLDCKVDALHDKLVSWVRRKSDEEAMSLLTTGTQLYTADDRYSARFIPPDIWRLEIKEVRATDAAFYDCQLSAHPPRTARVTLRVPQVSVMIVDGAGAAVSEQVCEVGSTVALRCEVRGLKMEGGPSLLWYRKNDLLNDDTTRGGISVRTEFGSNGANSVLRVARVRGDDAGRYTCAVARAPPPGPSAAHVILHVIKGESLAELHQGGEGTSMSAQSWLNVLALCALLQLLT
ncbi:hypothetical protein K1T71_004131 [Dendrolimus kikuchii]|uniref:Uncharacterized protein n=1 Tax=Dendrolimus kikuchii TaxID=765133 RepID=A0ACC1DBE6_9NEOP|nr:hypothetical protein K1T71_004131 [Dendrolimus kikuchii]